MFSCGSWRLEREIGHGAYGVVYLAFSPDGEPAAVKVCRRDAVDPERYSRELRGAKLYCAVPQKEGLVRMRAFAETEWGFYAVMDLADDEFERTDGSLESYRPKTLAGVIKGEKALPLKECVNLAVSLSKGLAALQRHHLLHRDIKPANVLYINGRPVLSDPGLVVDESEAASIVGTPGYVPPEKFTDAASDVYSLGLTLKAASFGRQIEDIDKGPALEADTGAPLFPAWWRILNKATDPTPSRRYQSAKALVKDLRKLQLRLCVATVKGLWALKTTIALFLVFAVVYCLPNREGEKLKSEIAPLKEFKTGMEEHIARMQREAVDSAAKARESIDGLLADLKEMNKENDRQAEKIERDSFWNSYSRAVNSYTDGVSDNLRLAKNTVRDIAEIRVINSANADMLQSSLDKISVLAAKEEALDREIDALRDEANEKTKNGLDDDEEYLQAKKLNEDRSGLHKELQNLVANLNTTETNMLERINRDWFWDLHNSRTCALNSEYIRDCMKRSIAVKEAGDTRVEYYRNISIQAHREHFEKFVKDEELHALARQEFARLMNAADEKTRNGLDDSAEIRQMRGRFFASNFYYDHLVNTMRPSWLLNTGFSDRVKFDYRFYDARSFSLRLESYMDLFRREMSIIAEEDKELGEKLRSDFDKLGKLLAKESSCQKDIDILHENACKKKQNGLDDAEEFLQAQKIAEEATTFHKNELRPLADQLYCRMRDYEHKRKESRWGDLYGYRHYSLDFELMKRGIKEIAAFSEKTASRLQKELDILAKGNARAMVFQKEIDSLRKKGKEKLQNGQDDAEEYTAAKRIFDKERSLYIYDVGNQVNYDMFNSLVSEVWRRTVSPVRWSWADKSGK